MRLPTATLRRKTGGSEAARSSFLRSRGCLIPYFPAPTFSDFANTSLAKSLWTVKVIIFSLT